MINLDRLETIWNKAQELNRPEIFTNALAKVLNNNRVVVSTNRLNQVGQLFSSRMKNYQYKDDVRIIVYPLGFTLNKDGTLERPFGKRTYIIETNARVLGNYVFLWPIDMDFGKSLYLDRESFGKYVKEHNFQWYEERHDRSQIYKLENKADKEDRRKGEQKQRQEKQARENIQRFSKRFFGHYFKYYGGIDWDGSIVDLRHAQIGRTQSEHEQLSKNHCFVYALEQNQINGKNISTEQIEQIRCQITSENLSTSEFKKIDTDVQIQIYNSENKVYICSKAYDPKDDDKSHIKITLWKNHYFYDKQVYVCEKPKSKAKKPFSTLTVLKRLTEHNRWSGELVQEQQEQQECQEPTGPKFKLNFNDQRPYQKQLHNYNQLGIAYRTQEQMMNIINNYISKNQDTTTLTCWKDNGIIYTISINGKVKYISYDCYGVKDQTGLNKLWKVKPQIRMYQSIGQFTIDQNIDLSGTYEMTRSLEEFFRAAFTKPFMQNQPGSYHDVVLLDMNSMYPYGLKEAGIYLGKAEPYSGSEYGILYNGQDFLFDHDAQAYYYSHEHSTDWVGVQFYGKRDVSKSIDEMFKLKADSNEDERGVYKLMLNSLYGRLGYKHENHQFKFEKKEKFQHRLVETNTIIQEWEDLDNDMVMYREKSEIKQSFYNQAHQAAALLHYGNQHYWKLVNQLTKPEHIIYANTDSIMVETKNINQIQDSKQIGQFKVEAQGDAYIIRHNMYSIYNGNQIIKQTNGGFKGTITLDQIKAAMNGQGVLLQQEKVYLTQYGFQPVLQNYKL